MNWLERLRQTAKASSNRGAYLIHSALLESHLWLVPDDRAADSLMAAGDVTCPIYTAQEIPKLKGLPIEALKAVHAVKAAFDGARIVSVARIGAAKL